MAKVSPASLGLKFDRLHHLTVTFGSQLVILLLMMCSVLAQAQTVVSISGKVAESGNSLPVEFANVQLLGLPDSNFVTGSVTDIDGRFTLETERSGEYLLVASYVGLSPITKELYVGETNKFIDVGILELGMEGTQLAQVEVGASRATVSAQLDRKSFDVTDNLTQTGGSVLQAMQSLPGVTTQDGELQLRGSNKVVVLIDGKQTALTGFGKATALDNIPASSIERIEIINNPDAKYDSNGNAGIINIIYKKEHSKGFTGKVGFNGGLGSLYERRANLPTIRPQAKFTPKLNPSLSLNYRTPKSTAFFQSDYLFTRQLIKNEFTTRTYDNGEVIQQQLKRNRNTQFTTVSSGIDYKLSEQNTLSVSGLFGSEVIIDKGDQPFFNADLSERLRLWQFLEDEVKTTVMATAGFRHAYAEPGHHLEVGLNYTFHREDERYFYDNILESAVGTDSFKLLSDEQVLDFTVDYSKPLASGRLEFGAKIRRRTIPTNMEFQPGVNSVIDANAGGAATYKEWIPAAYGNYIWESPRWEAEAGLRVEYVDLQYDVTENHPVYKSDGYGYVQPFPSLRLGYKIDDANRLALFGNRRVDRPNEVDIRIFPKYDDAEIIKVGNPALEPQFTNSIELGYKRIWNEGSFYAAAFGKQTAGTIARISTSEPGSRLIYNTFQNTGSSTATGVEVVLSQDFSKSYSLSANGSIYRNQFDAYSTVSLYPSPQAFSAANQSLTSGNLKLINTFHAKRGLDAQVIARYQAPDILPQGKIRAQYAIDAGLSLPIQNAKGELTLNATDLFGTLVVRRDIQAAGFRYTSEDFAETQVVRLGYRYSF